MLVGDNFLVSCGSPCSVAFLVLGSHVAWTFADAGPVSVSSNVQWSFCGQKTVFSWSYPFPSDSTIFPPPPLHDYVVSFPVSSGQFVWSLFVLSDINIATSSWPWVHLLRIPFSILWPWDDLCPWAQQKDGSCFLTESVSLCLFIVELRQLIV